MTARIIARSVHGLEWVCAAEISDALNDATQIRMARRQITFEVPTPNRRLLALRCADDAFMYVGEVDNVGSTKDALPILAKRLAGLDWGPPLATLRSIRSLPDRPSFDCVVSLEGRRNYNRYAAENSAGAALAPHIGGTFMARDQRVRFEAAPDLTVRLFLRDSGAIAALRLGSRPLHRRRYKADTGAGTLHPPAAAALAALVGPLDNATALDPFCGDGTIAIETALACPTARVLASDIDPARVANTRANATRAGVSLAVTCADAGRIAQERECMDAVLTNPPWNVAVGSQGSLDTSLNEFWARLPAILQPWGSVCTIVDADLDAPKALLGRGYEVGLKTQLRLAGRIVHLVLVGPPGGRRPRLRSSLSAWREQAIRAGVVTEEGF